MKWMIDSEKYFTIDNYPYPKVLGLSPVLVLLGDPDWEHGARAERLKAAGAGHGRSSGLRRRL